MLDFLHDDDVKYTYDDDAENYDVKYTYDDDAENDDDNVDAGAQCLDLFVFWKKKSISLNMAAMTEHTNFNDLRSCNIVP